MDGTAALEGAHTGMRILKALLGLLLLPLCAGLTRTLAVLLHVLHTVHGDHLSPSFCGLVIGFALWMVLYFAMPRPTRSYIFAHELTHALWAWLMGAEVRQFRVGGAYGSVQVSHANFLVTLAPYFCPFYTLCVMLLHFVMSVFQDQQLYAPFWLGLVGLTWAFHLTFTVSMLKTHQPDIHMHGRIFSYTVIYLMNILGISLWIVMVSAPTLELLVQAIRESTVIMYSAVYTWIWSSCMYIRSR